MAARKEFILLREILGITKGGEAAITWLFRDEFTTDDAAPISSPRTAEPGPGTLTVVDTDNKSSISSAALQLAPHSTPAAGDPGVWETDGLARVLGRTILSKVTPANLAVYYVGWDVNQTGAADQAFYHKSPGAIKILGNTIPVGSFSATNAYNYAAILRAAGEYYVIKGGAYTDWTLLWVQDADVVTPLYAVVNTNSATLSADYLRVADLPAPFDTEYGLATNRVASPGVDETTTSEGNALIEHTWTAVTGETYELSVRRVDDNNRWIIRGDQAGSTVKLIEEDATVETEISSVAQTWTNGTPYRTVVIQHGTTITVYIGNSQKITYSSASFQPTATGVKVSHAGTNLVTWPRVLSGAAKAVLDLYSA